MTGKVSSLAVAGLAAIHWYGRPVMGWIPNATNCRSSGEHIDTVRDFH
jgi:hypothetical protein